MGIDSLPVAALAWTLLHFLWQGALIGAAYALLRGLAETPQRRLLLGHLALLGMALAPIVTFALLTAASTPSAAPDILPLQSLSLVATDPLRPGEGFSWLAVLVAIWAAGVIVLSLRAAMRWLALRHICRMAIPAPSAMQGLVEALARRFGLVRPVALRLCSRLRTPVLVGFWRPVILIPAALAARMPLHQLELLVAHELAHVQRWDFAANLMQSVLEIVLYYHPMLHWVSARVRQDREECCDDLVARRFGSPVQYARALLAVAEVEAEQVPVPPFALAASGGVLLPRIERLLDVAPSPPAPSPHRAATALLMLALLALGFGLAYRAADAPEPIDPGPVLRAEIVSVLPGLRPALAAAIQLLPPVGMAAPGLGPGEAYAEAPAGPLPVGAVELAQPALSLLSEPSFEPGFEVGAPPVALTPLAPELQLPGPALLRYQLPEYPATVRARAVEGEVLMGFRILADGRVADIELISVDPPSEPELVQAVRQALRNWRFEPVAGGLDGQVRSFQFRLDDDEQTPRCLVQTGSRVCRNGDKTQGVRPTARAAAPGGGAG